MVALLLSEQLGAKIWYAGRGVPGKVYIWIALSKLFRLNKFFCKIMKKNRRKLIFSGATNKLVREVPSIL